MISFVIPAHNEARLIGRTLDALRDAMREIGDPYEVIVVDDASTDDTAALAAAAGARVIGVEFRQIARTRNAGARAAEGDRLVFVDADTIVPVATLRAALAALAAGAAGGGAAVEIDGRLPRWARLLLPLFLLGMRVNGLFGGCFVFCRRQAFADTGGFDERLYAAEEIAFARALARVGRVVVLRQRVVTSGRKLRLHSAWDLVRLCGRLAREGPALLRRREHLQIWYGERRPDPDAE